GALQEFFSREHTFDRVMGTSAGAITATLLAAGYNTDELLTALNEQDGKGNPIFASFMGAPPALTRDEIQTSDIRAILSSVNSILIPDFIERRLDDAIANLMARSSRFINLFAFVQRGGWYSAHAFIDWLSRKLDEGTFQEQPRNFSKMTLAEFFAATKTELTMIAADVTDAQILILNHRTAPNLPLVYAVRMSMSIPLLWDEVIWQPSWGTYRDRDMTSHAIVDGGVLSNFPIELFVSGESFVTDVMGPKQSTDILGCLIEAKMPVLDAPAPPGKKKLGFLSGAGNLETVHRLSGLVETILEARDKVVIEAFEHLIVCCPAKGYGTTEFNMSEERRKALVTAGRNAMRDYFERPEPADSRGMGGLLEDPSVEIAARRARRLLGD
ncbi:MAG: patatin-like phospholipase family protein, partial [Candidatus Promineifilaceae bacterium]